MLLSSICLSSCTEKTINSYVIVLGKTANVIELNVAEDLKKDLEKVLAGKVSIISENDPLPKNKVTFIIGTSESNSLICNIDKNNSNRITTDNPGARGGAWSKLKLENGENAIVLIGSDSQGLQYAIYDYSKEILEIDPLEYWTGKFPKPKTWEALFDFEPKRIPPPKVPILCYFENDVDELANYRGKLLEYDWETYTEMINSLVRLRYNAIQLFDMLGRPEFFIRPEYKALHPDYKIDIAYLEKMIDYAQSKGMKVAIDFALGYQINPMSAEKASCWSEYNEDWISAWRYYLEETPLKKTDIFMIRPRHQVWDWEYQSSCGEDKIEVFNEVYKVFGDLVDEYKPNADKVLVCYSDGMQMWNDGFRPPKDWIVCWSDDGFGDFRFLPKTTDEYEFGTYMHAGFWSNHTVHNPYPEKVATVMKNALSDFKADRFCLVNGQNFRPFLLNVQAYSAVCQNPDSFNGEAFYKDWCTWYFGQEAAPFAADAMKNLHNAQFGSVGYVQNLWEIREAIAYLSNTPIERPGKSPVPYTYERVQNDFEDLKGRLKYIGKAVSATKKGEKKVGEANLVFYYDYVQLPIYLYEDLLNFETRLHEMSKLKRAFEQEKNPQQFKTLLNLLDKAKADLKIIYERRLDGDKNPKWSGWYDPAIRRPNNGFPTREMLIAIEENLTQLVN